MNEKKAKNTDMKIIFSKFLYCILFVLCANNTMSQELKLKYLGTAGWEMSDGKVTILIDPYISRIKLGSEGAVSKDDYRKSFSANDYIESDTALIDSIIKKADFILVHHSHFDHLSDVPYIAKKTKAKIIATETSCAILKAYGIPDDQLYIVKGGEDYQFENFSVQVVPSIHSALNKKHYFDSRTYSDNLKVPLRVKDFVEGGSLMFYIRFASHTILTAGSMNFLEREVQGLSPDILIPGVNLSRLEIYKYTERLMKATGFPATVIPTHWDNYRVPYGFSQQNDVEKKIVPFIAEVKAASPASRVITPVHLQTIIIK